MKSEELREQIAEARDRRARLEIEADEAASAAASLKNDLAEAEGLVALRRQEIADNDRRIAQIQEAVREAEREEARERYDAAAIQLTEAISALLARLREYELAESELVTLGNLGKKLEKPDVLREEWEDLVDAVRMRSDAEFADEIVTAAVQSRIPDAIDALPTHLREAARTRLQGRRRARQGES